MLRFAHPEHMYALLVISGNSAVIHYRRLQSKKIINDLEKRRL